MKIKYGIEKNNIDITEICLSKLKNKNIIEIPLNKNNIFTDPCPNILKKIFVITKNKTQQFCESDVINIDTKTKDICVTNKKNFYKKRNIIYVWTVNPGPFNVPQNSFTYMWGIGDIIRGMMALVKTYVISQHEVFIDIFNHPIAKYLSLKDYKYKEFTKKNIDKVYWCGGDIEDYVNSKDPDDPILIMTNTPFKNINTNKIYIGKSETRTKVITLSKIYQENSKLKFINTHPETFTYKFDKNTLTITRTDENKGWEINLVGTLDNKHYKELDKIIKNKILDLFVKNKELKKDIDDIKKKLDLKDDYSIIHFRLGDHQLVRNNNVFNNFDKFYEKYLLHKKENQLVISDNILFRKYLMEKEKNIKILNTTDITHLGRNKENIKDTLIEFFLVLESKSIKTHSVNGWTSGFVLYPSILKDIPLQNI